MNDNMVFELDAGHLSLDATPMIAPRDNTRRRNYITHRVRREYANLCVRNSSPYLLNNTDQIILNKTTSHSLHGFAIYIKNSILNTYKDECNIDNCYICFDRPL